MPQNGFHGLAGLAAAKGLANNVPAEFAAPFVGALVIGAMLPDIDMYPTAIAFLAKRGDLILVIHRSLTHSLLLVAVLALSAMLMRRQALRYGLWGLALGISTHIALDALFWFTQIDLFWPFSHLPATDPALPVVNLWSGTEMPSLFVNIREAFEFAAFAFLLQALIRIAPEDARLKPWRNAAWAYFGVTMVTAFILREDSKLQNVVVTGPYLLFFLPFCWAATWRHRSAIADWARGESARQT